ncbi:MAG: hypothetical protein ACXAC8_04480 [Candidatus Hodarchaeales archaeon]|jgi:hypothetical protein
MVSFNIPRVIIFILIVVLAVTGTICDNFVEKNDPLQELPPSLVEQQRAGVLTDELWSLQLNIGEWGLGQPVLGDLDNDQVMEIIFYASDNNLYAVNGSSQFLKGWPQHFPSEFVFQQVIVADFFNDNYLEVMVLQLHPSGSLSGLIFDYQGQLQQNFSLVPEEFGSQYRNARIQLLPAHDSTPAMVCVWSDQITTNHSIFLINPMNNSFQEFQLGNETHHYSYILPHFNFQIQTWEFYVLTDGAQVYCLYPSGEIIREFFHPQLVNNTTPQAMLVAYQPNKTQNPLILLLNASGTVVGWEINGKIDQNWSKQLEGEYYEFNNYPIVVDLDKDGSSEILFLGTDPNKLHVFQSSGSPLPGWPVTIQLPLGEWGRRPSGLFLVDIDQDFVLEIGFSVVGIQAIPRIHFINHTGGIVESWTSNRPSIYHLIVGDITGDNLCEAIWVHRDDLVVIQTDWFGHSLWSHHRSQSQLNTFFDEDYDGIIDSDEEFFQTNPASNDSDNDELNDLHELAVWGTDPTHFDTDRDGLSDSTEIMQYFTDPTEFDTDKDDLSDGIEVMQYFTDPTEFDTDADGLSDYVEIIQYLTDPTLNDTDTDGLLDSEEINQYDTNPLKPDSDDDKLLDGEEITQYGTNVSDPDSDNDALLDGDEIKQYGTDPLIADTDGDGVADGIEVILGLNALNPEDVQLISRGLILLGVVMSLATGIMIFRIQKQKLLKQGWKRILQDQHIAPLNIIDKAAKEHIAPEQAIKWLEEFLAIEPPDRVAGLYNPEKLIFLSQKTLQLWLDTMAELPLESLASSLELSIEEIKSQLQKIGPVQRGEWVLSPDYHLHRSRP